MSRQLTSVWLLSGALQDMVIQWTVGKEREQKRGEGLQAVRLVLYYTSGCNLAVAVRACD